MNSFNTAVGSLLYQNRMINGLTESEMAKKCGIDLNDYCDFECGKKSPSLQAFIDISIACNIDISAFFEKIRHSSQSFETSEESKIIYCTEEEDFTSDDGIPYTGYNVIIRSGNIIVTRFTDVFLNKEAAFHFVEMCNRLELDPNHVADVIDDVLIT